MEMSADVDRLRTWKDFLYLHENREEYHTMQIPLRKCQVWPGAEGMKGESSLQTFSSAWRLMDAQKTIVKSEETVTHY